MIVAIALLSKKNHISDACAPSGDVLFGVVAWCLHSGPLIGGTLYIPLIYPIIKTQRPKTSEPFKGRKGTILRDRAMSLTVDYRVLKGGEFKGGRYQGKSLGGLRE